MRTSDLDHIEAAAGRLPSMWRSQLQGSGAVAALELKLAEFYGMRNALCVASASSGLMGLAVALGMRNRDFLTTPYTYGASIASWLLLGNRPVFTDIDPGTLTLDPNLLRPSLTRRTAAVLAVDIYGHPADSEALRAFAEEHGLWYVADAAQSFGATRDGRPASARAHALVLSFTVGKTLEAGEGGAVLTDSDELYSRLLWNTQHPDRQKLELGLDRYNEFALNARIHPVAALRANRRFGAALRRVEMRQRACLTLAARLDVIGLTEPMPWTSGTIRPAFFRFSAAWRGERREAALLAALSDYEQARIVPAPVQPVYMQQAFTTEYGHFRFRRCPIAESQAQRRFCITFQNESSTAPETMMHARPARGTVPMRRTWK